MAPNDANGNEVELLRLALWDVRRFLSRVTLKAHDRRWQADALQAEANAQIDAIDAALYGDADPNAAPKGAMSCDPLTR